MMKHTFTCLIEFLICFNLGTFKNHPFQLSDDIKPLEYDLSIAPNLPEGTYEGVVKITVNATKAVSSITLHSKNLNILRTTIGSTIAKISRKVEYDFLILSQSKQISIGIHTIQVNFTGDMKNKTYGFFRGYEEVKGRKVYFGTTFFEPINARIGFPCFDEPIFKARFTIHITKPPGYVALSNMNVIKETKVGNNYTVVHFAKTPPMSTYLVVFFVGKYGYREQKYKKLHGNATIPVRIYSPPEKLGNTDYCVKQIPKLLSWFVNYTGFEFMLPKLDYVTLNRKFHIEGGMENWGMTTSREDSIFYNNNMSVLLKSNALNMAHEFAHIWFGDLLTTSSWSEFWMNEGFARFMDKNSVRVFFPQSQEYLSKLLTMQNALWIDDRLSQKSLNWEVKTPTDVYDILNSINYDKGGSILAMVEDLIGKRTMQAVIKTYIRKYQYRNVHSQDFIDTLQSFVAFNATDFLEGFISQPGYPLISVTQPSQNQITLTRTRFLRVGEPYRHKRWTVPIKYATNLNSSTSQLIWIPADKDKVTIQFPKSVNWVKLNLHHGGYYRTNYPEKMWQTFNKLIQGWDIRDKMHLIDDAFGLVRANKLQCGVAFKLTTYLVNEERYEAWTAAQYVFGHIRTGLLQNNISTQYLKKYVSRIIDKQYHKMKWTIKEKESLRTKNTRQVIFNLACAYGHSHCLQKVRELWPKRRILPVDIYNIVAINDPTRPNSARKPSSEDSIIEESHWFGANLSQIRLQPPFQWPKNISEACDRWLKNNA